mgnify:CR=1 FL=1
MGLTHDGVSNAIVRQDKSSQVEAILSSERGEDKERAGGMG